MQSAAPNGIILRWRTDVACESVVNYGTQTNELTSSKSDPSLTTEHEVRLTGLTPATRYFYSVGPLTGVQAEGPDYYFITFPLPGPPKPTRVWVTGDAGQCFDDGQTLMRDGYYQYAGLRHTDVWLSLGDNSFSGQDDECQTSVFDVYPEMFRQTAYWSALGNHDFYPMEAGEGLPHLDMFSFPTNGEAGGVASGSELYYSFDYANIHFICLDSASQVLTGDGVPTNGPMANWLRADLAATTSDWIIAFWHHPPYSKGGHDSDTEAEMIEMRQNIVPILEARGVDLVLSGHSHVYERSYLLRGHYGDSSTLQPEMILDAGSGQEEDTGAYIKATSGPKANHGTVYVEVGCSGYVSDYYGHHPVMFADEAQLGSLVLDITGNRLDAAFLRETGAIDDSFTIIKAEPEPLRFCEITLKNGEVILRWKSTPGRYYWIEHSEIGQAPNWHPVGDPVVATDGTTCWTNAMPPGPAYYYRVLQAGPRETRNLKAGAAAQKPTVSGLEKPRAQAEPSLIALGESLPGPLPIHPDRKQQRAADWAGEGAVCDTTYWRRRIKPQAAHSRPRWQLASAPAKIFWRQTTLRG